MSGRGKWRCWFPLREWKLVVRWGGGKGLYGWEVRGRGRARVVMEEAVEEGMCL